MEREPGMEVTPALVKELRERTGAGMMDCKKALVESAGDIDAAADLLRMAGQAKADKKASRVAAEGQVVVVSDEGAGRHAIVEVNSETDFAANDANFRQFADLVGRVVVGGKAASVDALMQLDAGGRSVEEARQALVAKIGENIAVRRFEVLAGQGTVGSYVHMNRIGVLVVLEGGSRDLAKDLAMQVAATSPRYVSIDEVPAEELAKEREIFSAQAAQEGKPPEIVAKMVEGRLRKHFDEVTLIGQPFVKDPESRVKDLLKKNGATVKRFVRYEVGEGIDKKRADFGEEVAALL
jgi:elongation factor Ts